MGIVGNRYGTQQVLAAQMVAADLALSELTVVELSSVC